MKQTKVFLLDCGSMCLDQSYMFLDSGLTGDRRFPVYGVLIDHADGLFLFDSGFDHKHTDAVAPFTKPLQKPNQTIPVQLETAGFRARDVSHVVNSHYHIDHVGGNHFCKHATTVCHQCELDAWSSPSPAEELGYSDISLAPTLRKTAGDTAIEKAPDIYTPRIETIKGDQEIAKGIFLFETTGHTAGHYSLMVKLQSRRPMLFTADACYSQKNVDMRCLQAGNHDHAQAMKSLDRLLSLSQQHDAELFYSHDPESWPQYTKAPGYYA